MNVHPCYFLPNGQALWVFAGTSDAFASGFTVEKLEFAVADYMGEISDRFDSEPEELG